MLATCYISPWQPIPGTVCTMSHTTAEVLPGGRRKVTVKETWKQRTTAAKNQDRLSLTCSYHSSWVPKHTQRENGAFRNVWQRPKSWRIWKMVDCYQSSATQAYLRIPLCFPAIWDLLTSQPSAAKGLFCTAPSRSLRDGCQIIHNISISSLHPVQECALLSALMHYPVKVPKERKESKAVYLFLVKLMKPVCSFLFILRDIFQRKSPSLVERLKKGKKKEKN